MTEITVNSPGTLARLVQESFLHATLDQSEMDPEVLSIVGMSGKRYRRFINNLIRRIENATYLEVGSWAGSTLCSAINRNKVTATAIDNWSQFGGPKDRFLDNLAKFATNDARVNFIENDFRAVDYSDIGKFGVYLFDGPHEYQDQYDGLSMALPALTEQFVFIVDDWNWAKVRNGTIRAINDAGLTLDYALEIRTTLDDTQPEFAFRNGLSDWHNGYFISVLSKR